MMIGDAPILTTANEIAASTNSRTGMYSRIRSPARPGRRHGPPSNRRGPWRPGARRALPWMVALHGRSNPPEATGMSTLGQAAAAGLHVLSVELADGLGQHGNDLEQIAHHAVIRDLEDRRFGILVDRDDAARRRHSGKVLDRAGDPDGHVELG